MPDVVGVFGATTLATYLSRIDLKRTKEIAADRDRCMSWHPPHGSAACRTPSEACRWVS